MSFLNKPLLEGYFSLVIVEHSYVSQQGKARERQAVTDHMEESLA